MSTYMGGRVAEGRVANILSLSLLCSQLLEPPLAPLQSTLQSHIFRPQSLYFRLSSLLLKLLGLRLINLLEN
jgi:hypothetical protein